MHKTTFVISVTLLAAAVIVTASAAFAFWLMDGKAVCRYSGSQVLAQCVPGQSGGLVAVYLSTWTSGRNVKLQAMDSAGAILWDESGETPYLSPSIQSYPSAVIKENGYPMTVWQDDIQDRDPTNPPDTTMIFASISFTGSQVFLVTDIYTVQAEPATATDTKGGVIVTWADGRAEYPLMDIYAQRLSGTDGSRLWSSSGVAVCTVSGNQSSPMIIPDGSGGAIIAWYDKRNDIYSDIYAQRLDSLGTPLWTADGVCVCCEASSQRGLDLASDGSGGAVFVWYDSRRGTDDIFAQHIDAAGTVDWQTDGVVVCANSSDEYHPVIAGDGKGGAYFAWSEYDGLHNDICVQRLNGIGGRMWDENGINITNDPYDQSGPQILLLESGDCYVSWADDRRGDYDLRLQKLDFTGTALWAQEGVIVCSSESYISGGCLITDGAEGAYLAWNSYREGNSDIYAARIFPDGSLGWEPSLDSAADLPGDEGGWARLSVTAPTHDNAGVDYYQVTGYNIWRKVDAVSSNLPAADACAGADENASADLAEGSDENASADTPGKTFAEAYTSPPERLFAEASEPGDIFRAPAAADYEFPPGDWESIGYSAARQLPSYLFAVPTRSDSTRDGMPWEHFVVSIHTTDPAFYFIVGPDSAYSVDNLAPAPPAGLAGTALEGPPGIELTWEPNAEADISHYSVYRGSFELFMPGRSNYQGSTTETSFTDEYEGWYESWYKVAAIDRHGNSSTLAVIGPGGMVTGDDPVPAPSATFLAQNFPNPFNPATTIAFGLKAGGHVSLRIYDAAGRLVSTLIEESRPAGEYTAVWDGKDDAGVSVASGIYFYRLETNRFTETRKMILIR